MNIPINDDFERNYKIEAWKGFDLREVAAIALALGISVAISSVLVFFFQLPLMISFYIGILPAVPVVVLAFWRSPLGMSLPAHLRVLAYHRATKELWYRACEYPPAEEEYEHLLFSLNEAEARQAESPRRNTSVSRRQRRQYVRVWRKKRREQAKSGKEA